MRPEPSAKTVPAIDRLPNVRLHLDEHEVVELVELLRLRFFDGDVPVLHDVGSIDESDGLLARDLEKTLEGGDGKGLVAEGHVELALAEVFLEHLAHHDESDLGGPPLRELGRRAFPSSPRGRSSAASPREAGTS